MDITDVIATFAVLVTAGGLYFAWLSWRAADRAARAAESQVSLQQELNKAAGQPYVWADVRLNEFGGKMLDLVIGNSGPTVAQDVRVTIEPPLPVVLDEPYAGLSRRAQQRLEQGIQSLAPGKRLHWFIGQSHNIVGDDVSQQHTFTINATGPHGPVDPLVYVLDLADSRESQALPMGSLHKVTQAVDRLSAVLQNKS